MKVKGTVEVARIIEGYGFKGTYKRNVKGETYTTWVTVWTQDKVTEGEMLEVTGDLSVKLESFTGRDNQPKQTAAIHINDAVLKREEAPF
jgi:hypothetical protein